MSTIILGIILRFLPRKWNQVSEFEIVWGGGAHYNENKVTASVWVPLEV